MVTPAPGLTVLPRRERPNAAAIKQKVTQLLEMVQLGFHLATRYPSQLSGGQKQRCAGARPGGGTADSAVDGTVRRADAQVRKKVALLAASAA